MGEFEGLLSLSHYRTLLAAAPDGQVVVHGKTDRDASKWERISGGDLALFYHRRIYFARGSVALTLRNSELALKLWGRSARSTHGLHDRLIFFSRLSALELPAKRLNTAVGYVSRFVLYGFQVVTGERVAKVKALLKGSQFVPREANAGNSPAFIQDIDSVVEGQASLVQHIKRERSRKLISAKKAEVLRKTGRLACEACGFDFRRKYPWIDAPFAEVHHKEPLAGSKGPTTTSLAALAILCANCHRMIHRTRPMMTVEGFRAALNDRRA